MLVKFGLYSEIEGYDKIVNADDLGEILLKNLEIYLNGIFEYSGSCQILNNTYKYIYECMKMIRLNDDTWRFSSTSCGTAVAQKIE